MDLQQNSQKKAEQEETKSREIGSKKQMRQRENKLQDNGFKLNPFDSPIKCKLSKHPN